MPGDIANYKMPNFAKQHFRQSTKSNIRKDQELSYTKKPISMSLLPMSDELSKRAVDLFGKILMFTSKKPPAKPEMIVEYIMTEALVEEKLRDELYCQVARVFVSSSLTRVCCAADQAATGHAALRAVPHQGVGTLYLLRRMRATQRSAGELRP